ncbi:MAG TPA: RHS repeat-associated core domain-containing protein, partial [Thermoguttaceae bacterium]|nr:RHS repeat-associated core domain-containing protein [Thermoguttaceae bacterium]
WYDGLGRGTASAYYGREDIATGETHYFFDGSGDPDGNNDGVPDRAEANRPQTYAENAGSAAGFGFQLQLTQYNDAGLAYRTIDDLGRIDETQYDDAGRVVKTIQNYADGTPAGADTEQDITVAYEYDSGGRLVTMTANNAKGSGDPEAQATKYLYTSPINAAWQTAVVYPDSADALTQNGTTKVWTITSGSDHVSTLYDRLGRTETTTDQRGIVHTYTYDTAGRLAVDAVTAPGGWGNVDHSVEAVVTTYDDVGRVEYVTSYSSSNPAEWDFEHTVNQVKYEYNEFGEVNREYQEHNADIWANSIYIDYYYDDGSYDDDAYYDPETGYYLAKYVRPTMVRYPKLSQYVIARSVEYLYAVGSIDDLLSRPTNISTTGSVANASYKYLGADWVVTEDLTNIDITLDHAASNFDALDRFGRVVDQLWECYGTTWEDYNPANLYPDYYSYTYNRAGNIATRSTQNASLNETYLYDALDRLTDVDRANGFDQTWGLDGLGNFSAFDDDGAAQTRTVDEANQIETIISDDDWVSPDYDLAGNMIFGPDPDLPDMGFHYVYDAWNRLAATYQDDGDEAFEPGAGDALVAEYVYDGLGRRVMKTDDRNDVDALSRHYYYNTDWQILEDRETYYGVEEVNQYIWSPRYVDSPIACLHDGNADGDVDDDYPDDWRRYYLTDANHNVTTTLRIDNYNEIAWTGNDGVSRNVYTPYGEVTRCLEDWTPGGSAEELFDGPMFAGYFLDTDTGLYQVRNRFYDANLSAFLNRDPVGYAGGSNLYAYCGDSPTNRTDPSGLFITVSADQQEPLRNFFGSQNLRFTDAGNGMYRVNLADSTAAQRQLGQYAGDRGYKAALWEAVIAADWRGSLDQINQTYVNGGVSLALGGPQSRIVGILTRPGGNGQPVPIWADVDANGKRTNVIYGGQSPEISMLFIKLYAQSYAEFVGTMAAGEIVGGVLAARVAAKVAPSAIRYGAHLEGPLPSTVANTFRGGSYTQTTLQAETTLYRTYGGSSGQLGSYWSRTAPQGPLQASMDLALPPGNTAQNVLRITVPKGTVIYEGSAATNFGRLGGGNQVFVPRVNPSWVKP